MNPFLEVLTRMMPPSDEMPVIPEIKIPKSHMEYLQWQCDNYNKTAVASKDGIDCPECLNRGYISVIKDDVIVQRECQCMITRRGFLKMEAAGFGKIAEKYTFDRYVTREEWQKRAKEKAMKYVRENPDKWLFFGGQSGCGKTHLCTAVCMELMNQRHDVLYVLWRDLVHYMEQNRFKGENYNAKIWELQDIEVLYIDDFLKTTCKDQYGKLKPSEMELNTAYEIVNSRIISGKKTIISSELHINDISVLDEATGGRISEASENWQIMLNYDKTRNFRFYGKESCL